MPSKSVAPKPVRAPSCSWSRGQFIIVIFAAGLCACAPAPDRARSPAATGPEGVDLSYNPSEVYPFTPESATRELKSTAYPNGWVRLWQGTVIQSDMDEVRELSLQRSNKMIERAVATARERKHDYIAILEADLLQVDYVVRGRFGRETGRSPFMLVSNLLFVTGDRAGRGWLTLTEFGPTVRERLARAPITPAVSLGTNKKGPS